MNTHKDFDLVIIGGGPAGMMAALSAREKYPTHKIAVLDKTFELGRKFLTSGAGRGNLTNVHLQTNPASFFHGDHTLITSVFSRYGYTDIMRFFAELGVPTYEEKKTSRGKIFPRVDNAKTVRDMLVDRLIESEIAIYTNVTIESIHRNETRWIIKTRDESFAGRAVIITAGGRTYPALGADGSGYALAATLGHRIITPVVTAVPLISKNILSHLLQGEKMVCQATSIIGGSEITTAVGDVMFTQYGFSGPAIFDISHDVSVRINREGSRDTSVRLSFFPGQTTDDVQEIVLGRLRRHASMPVAHSLWGLFTQKAAGALCAIVKIPKEQLAKDLSDAQIDALIIALTAFTTDITDTRGWNEGEFTAGGVDTNEIDTRTLESKLQPDLYFAGEILNVDGQVGGFNLSWAWATGWIAGRLGEVA